MKTLLTLNDLTKIYQVDRSTVYRWINKGMPHTNTPGGRKRFDIDEIKKWVKDNSK